MIIKKVFLDKVREKAAEGKDIVGGDNSVRNAFSRR